MATTYTLISSVTVGSGGAANMEFTSIAADYTDLVIKISGRTNASNYVDDLMLQFNSDTGSNYSYRQLYGTGSAAGSGNATTSGAYIGTCTAATATASTFGNLDTYIPNYAGSANKSVSADAVTENNATGSFVNLVASLWSNTSAITSIRILSLNGNNFVQYSSAYLYGISNA
jgi:hypothetical protein